MTDWSEEQPTIELLKQTITMHEVVELLGYEVGSDNKITSPWNPDERTPSCHVYEDHIYDYSTGNHADIIDLVMILDPEITNISTAIWLLWNKALRAGKEPGDVEREPLKSVVDFTDDWPSHIMWDRFMWEREIGCPLPFPTLCLEDTSNGQTFQPSNNLLIAHRDADGIYGVKVRTRAGAKSAWPGSQFTKRLYHPFGHDYIYPGPGIAVITEGESDCWHVQHLISGSAEVFALPSGAGSWKDSWLEDLEPYERVVLIMDNDAAGKQARDKLERKIGFLRVEHEFVPQLYSDVREAVAAGWDGASLRQRVQHQCNTR